MFPEWEKCNGPLMWVIRWTVVKVGSWVSRNCPVVGELVSILSRILEVVWEGEVVIGEW